MNIQANSKNKILEQNSIIQESKRQKALKEAGGVSFGAAILSQNYDIAMIKQANDIAELSTKAISVINNETMPTQIVSTNLLQNNINAIKFSDHAYGYSVDSSGFMGEDFNKAAKLPENFKIHKSTLDELQRYANQTYLYKPNNLKNAFDNIDMADTIGKYYKLFSGIMGKNLQQNYTTNEISKLPRGFDININQNPFGNDGSFLKDIGLFEVTNVYKDMAQIDEEKTLSSKLSKIGVSLSVHMLNLAQTMQKNLQDDNGWSFNPQMSMYENEQGYSQSGVFVSFLKNFPPIPSNSGDTKLNDASKSFAYTSYLQSSKDDTANMT